MAKSEKGRPTKFKPEEIRFVTNYCLLGATNEDLAKFFEVNVDTIYEWMKVHADFSDAIKEGREIADANVGSRLYQRAMGFEHDSEEIKVINDGVLGQYIERVPVRKIYPPDSTAAIFWLKNRQRTKWRDRTETAFTDPEGNAVIPTININVVRPDDDTKKEL